jgi:hypothetical protein
VTPALARLQAELVGLQAGALAESTKAKYLQYEVYWVQFLLVFRLVRYVVQPTEAVVSLDVAFLARSVSYGTVKNYLQGLQRSSWTAAGLVTSLSGAVCSRRW